MSDQQPNAVEHIEQAIDAIPSLDSLFEQPAEPAQRDDAGRFAKDAPEPEAKAKDDAAEPAEKAAKDAKATDDKGDDAEAEEAEDYIEIPGEGEGAQPTKLKIAEVLDGYKKAQTYEAELAELRTRAQSMPVEAEQQMAEAIRARQQYMAGVQQLQQWMQPRWPDEAMLDERHPAYNPAAYRQQFEAAKQVVALQQQLDAESRRVAAENDEVARTVLESRRVREWSEAVKVWPEIKDQATRKEVVGWLKSEGYSDQEIDKIDARDLKVIKRAYLHDKAKVAQETTAKVVKATPKLVRPQARQTGNGKSAAANQAMERLGKTGSFDDAIAALENIL